MSPSDDGARRVSWRLLSRFDAAANWLYGSHLNPLYRSGTLTVALLLVLLVTGLYLLLFYRVGAPYESVTRITNQVWLGRWIRGVHRFAADAAVVTAAVHAVRMFAQRRSWGRRAMPWLTGLGLFALILVCGWTGYVMVWDTFGRLLAVEGARLLDLLPLFSEPLGRAFVGERPIPGAFFFLNLFLHIALPIGMGIVLLLHVSRVARPALLPARPLLWGSSALLIGVALVWPLSMAPPADPLRLPTIVPVDAFYAFWLPVAGRLPAGLTAGGAAAIVTALLLVPRLTRPRVAPSPSSVNERLCTGCEQCALDCPYEAITMIARTDGRDALVARVDPARCVSCGVCAGSCAPMGVGPPGRTGRDQLAAVRAFAERHRLSATDVVVLACNRGAGGVGHEDRWEGAPVLGIDCAGNLHTSVVEFLIRAGAGGTLILACPNEDCWNREGAVWLEQRLFHEREAELRDRVDHRRVMLVNAGRGERTLARRALADFRRIIRTLDAAPRDDDVDLLRICDDAVAEAGDAA